MRTATADVRRTETAVARLTATEPVGVHLTVNAKNRLTATANALARAATARIRTATAEPRLATSQVRQTANAQVRQTGTAQALNASTHAAATSLAANARYATTAGTRVAKTYTAVAKSATEGTAQNAYDLSYRGRQTQTAVARTNARSTARNIGVITARANNTLVALTRAPATRLTATAYAPTGAPLTRTASAPRTLVEQTAETRRTARVYSSATSAVRTATARVRQTATALARPTRSPSPTTTAGFQPQAAETFYINRLAGVNARSCPRHQTNPCDITQKLAYGAAVAVVGEARGELFEGSTRWMVIESNDRLIYIHAALLSSNPPVSSEQTNSGVSSSNSSSNAGEGSGESSSSGSGGEGSSSGSGGSTGNSNGRRNQQPSDSRNSYPGLTCKQIRERYGDGNFRPDHPAYSNNRDRDNDGIACEK